MIIAKGRLVRASSLADLEAHARPAVRLVSPDVDGLARLIAASGWSEVTRFEAPGVAVIEDHHPAQIGAAAFAQGLEVHELSSAGTSLESLFLELTSSAEVAR